MKYTTLTLGLALALSACAQQQSTTSRSADVPVTASSASSARSMIAMQPASSKKAGSSAMTQKSSAQTSSVWNLKDAMAAMPATKEAWLKIITADQYSVLWDEGTETPFTSPLLNEHRKGTFVSADCGEPVFRSEQKYDSGTGWPSFWAPISADAVVEKEDRSFGSVRTEIQSKCGGHLGHVFTDGPQPTGLRYCMNGLALRFIPDAVQD